MTNAVDQLRKSRAAHFATWCPLATGLLLLFVPTSIDLATGLWSTEGYSHGPIIFGLAMWLIVRQWQGMLRHSQEKPGDLYSWLICIVALLFYIAGRSQGILIFEIGSFILLFAGMLMMFHGWNAIKVQWFPIFFMLFMIPLPSEIVSMLTLPMKLAVSYVTEQLLFWSNYPVARSGVILQIGHYKLMVADACAGLQTLLTLEALGLFYLNLISHSSRVRNVVLAILIIPISFTANVIRVIALSLITYHFGDAAGQGFLHGFAGMFLFISALLLIISADSLIQRGVRLKKCPR